MAFLATSYDLLQEQFVRLPFYFNAEQSIVAAFCLIYVAKFAQANLSFLLLGKYDNVQASFRYGAKSDSWRDKTVERAYNAHLNSWEAFTGFSVAMLMALQLAPSQKPELDMLGNAFVLVRGAFIISYILAFNTPLSAIRSSIFLVGMIIIYRIFVIALSS